MRQFDLAVIGSGAGLIVMEAALKKGKTVAVVEKGAFGGTCLNRGCIPSKMLVYPADLIREAQRGERVGVTYPEPVVDWAKITRRMRRQIDVNQQLEEDLGKTPGVTLFKGEARFLDGRTLQVHLKNGREERLGATDILIAAGARTRVPLIKGLEEAGYVTSESFFAEKFPEKPYESLIIIGGGSTACEFAHIFSAFGTKVTLAVRSETILREFDREISNFVSRELEAAGVKVVYFAGAQAVRREEGQVTVDFTDNRTGETYSHTAQELFLAPGIVPLTDALGLEAAGVRTDKAGYIETDSRLSTSAPHIWALGDINGKFPLRHKANYEAEVLGDVLYGTGLRRASYASVPQAVFTHPQAAAVGMSEEEARAAFGQRVRVHYNRYSSIVAGIAMGYSRRREDNGFAKIISDDQKRILGAHIVGPQAAALVQPYAFLMNAGGEEQAETPGTWLPVERAMTIHPALSELAAWALIYPPAEDAGEN